MILLGQTYAELVLRASKQTFAAREHTHTAANISGVPKLVADKFAGSLVLPFAGAMPAGAMLSLNKGTSAARPIVVLYKGKFWAQENNLNFGFPYYNKWTVTEAADEIYSSEHYADCNIFYNTTDGSVWTRQGDDIKPIEAEAIPADQFTELN